MRRPGSAAPAAPTAAAPTRRTGKGPSIPDAFEVSLGRALVIGAGVIVAIAIAYGIGVQRGRSLSGGSAPATEPVVAPGASTQDAASPRIPSLGGGTAKPAPKAPGTTDNTTDPRVKGLRYFVIAHPASQRAAEMVEFCRENGLEAFLVPDDNAMLRKIIVLPGYRDASEKSSPEIKALEAKIRSVGDKWKRSSKGNKDFSDAFPELFR
jgi:hypothetical protein